MDAETQPLKRRDNVIAVLNAAIDALNIAKDVSSITPAKAVFASVSTLLIMIKDSMINQGDYVALGEICIDICTALEQGMDGKKPSDINQPVLKAIKRLMKTVDEIKSEIKSKMGKPSKRKAIMQVFHARNDKEIIAGWRSDLNIVLDVFNTQLAVGTYLIVSDIRRDVSDIRRDMSQIRGRNADQIYSAQISPGESPPQPPRAFFGRDELVAKIVDLVGSFTPIALIGTGGIGKTSIALSVLHHDHIKEQFGDSRRFIRCDQFQATRTHFLSRLSKVIGAGIDNPEDLTPLRPLLSSKRMVLVLDNAESILDPQGTSAQEIYAVVEELSQFDNICLCITSRISTVPPDCQTLDIPTLPIEAARNAFYGVYKNGERSGLVDNILEQLDFHPLSVTLLATVAHHNKWDTNRLVKEWERRRTGVLQTDHKKSLATTIELSLASPMFQELGPDARAILEVVAFFPRGVNEDNLGWLFPTIPDRENIFDKFCALSLTYRSNGFATMLAPLRDNLRPRNPGLSPLLCAIKDHYFTRLAVGVDPDKSGFEETRWITLEDVNVEHLLDAFTSIDADSSNVWDACVDFMDHLYHHKSRLIVLGPKIENLPDDHPSKPRCLFGLSQLLGSVGHHEGSKRLLVHTSELWRERGDNLQVARSLMGLAHTNWLLGYTREGIPQAEEALKIYEQLDNTVGQADSLGCLAFLFAERDQFGPAEEAASRAVNLSSGERRQSHICGQHQILGKICSSRGEMEAAISHLNKALEISRSLNLQDKQSMIIFFLVPLLAQTRRFDDAQAYLDQLKLGMANNPFNVGTVMLAQAALWRDQGKFEEAKSEALRAIHFYKTLGVTGEYMEAAESILGQVGE